MLKIEAVGLCCKCHEVEGKLTYFYTESEWAYGYLCEDCHQRIKRHLKWWDDIKNKRTQNDEQNHNN